MQTLVSRARSTYRNKNANPKNNMYLYNLVQLLKKKLWIVNCFKKSNVYNS